MQLLSEHVPAFIELVSPDLTPVERLEKIDGLRGRIAVDPVPARRRVVLDGERVVASLHVFSPMPGEIWLGVFNSCPGAEHHAAPLIAECVELARRLGFERLQVRVDRARSPVRFRDALEDAGFVTRGGRQEFEVPVRELPRARERSPLTWTSMEGLGLEAVGALLERAGAGPELGGDEDGVELIQGYLSDPSMTNEPDCVQVGALDGVPVAFVVAQVERATGWCTITFMGLAPAYRGRGLGRWVHQRGFEILRQKGGQLYHGGTSDRNVPMLRLFARYGYRPSRRLVEMSLAL